MIENKCVCCGDSIPEGGQTCFRCEKGGDFKVQLDYPKLMRMADGKGIHTLSRLCNVSNVDYGYVRSAIYKNNTVNVKTYYLFAKTLGCHIDDIIKISR